MHGPSDVGRALPVNKAPNERTSPAESTSTVRCTPPVGRLSARLWIPIRAPGTMSSSALSPPPQVTIEPSVFRAAAVRADAKTRLAPAAESGAVVPPVPHTTMEPSLLSASENDLPAATSVQMPSVVGTVH